MRWGLRLHRWDGGWDTFESGSLSLISTDRGGMLVATAKI